jgi:hypothetical protein
MSNEERLRGRWPDARIVDKIGRQVWRPVTGAYTYGPGAPDRFEVVEGFMVGMVLGEGPTAEDAVDAALRYGGPAIKETR